VPSADEVDDADSVEDEEPPAQNGNHNDDGDSLLFELCPPPPLGGPLSSLHKPTSDGVNNKLHAVQSSPLDAPSTPTKKAGTSSEFVMGQWSTPTSARKPSVKLRKRMNHIDEIDEEDDDIISPQAKQRKKVSFPPSSQKLQRDNSTPDDASQAASIGPAPTVVFKEDWKSKTERLRKSSIYGSHDGWRLLPILIKSNDDLRQEQLASQLIQRMALILAKANVPVWLYPYEIVALTGRGGSECIFSFDSDSNCHQ
jgi:hypothetical protein